MTTVSGSAYGESLSNTQMRLYRKSAFGLMLTLSGLTMICSFFTWTVIVAQSQLVSSASAQI